MYIPDDKFLVMGGLERDSSITSSRCFIIDDKGKLARTSDMNVARQYFAIATDYTNDTIFIVGGYNDEVGLLGSFESFSIRGRKWNISDES